MAKTNAPQHIAWLLLGFCLLGTQLAACTNLAGLIPSTQNKHTLATNNGSITYSTSPNDVIVRTFYGGGNLGTLELSPAVSIYSDGSYILGPDLYLQQGNLSSTSLDQLLHTLVDTDGILNLHQQQFYDLPDQNATLLQLMLNGKSYEFLYGQFGNLQESTQDTNDYHRLGKALASITEALNGPEHSYTSDHMALLVHQDFSPDLTQSIASWPLKDFTLAQVATYECGPVPLDQTGPNADTGCLTFTIPHNALLLTAQQLQVIAPLLNGDQQAVFMEKKLYYTVALRPLLPDELSSQMVAMFGSQELRYIGIPLQEGPIPMVTPTPTP